MGDVSRQIACSEHVYKALSYSFIYLLIGETAMLRLFVKFYFILFISVLLYLLFGLYSQHTWLNEKLEEDRANDLVGTIYLLEATYENLGIDAFKKRMEHYPPFIQYSGGDIRHRFSKIATPRARQCCAAGRN